MSRSKHQQHRFFHSKRHKQPHPYRNRKIKPYGLKGWCGYGGEYYRRKLGEICSIGDEEWQARTYVVRNRPRKALARAKIAWFSSTTVLKSEISAIRILNIKNIDFKLLLNRCDECADEIHFYKRNIDEDIIPLIKTAYIMANKYNIVATNPPYMNKFSPKLKDFINKSKASNTFFKM